LEESFVDKLVSFAKVNQYVDRQEYKEKWEQWILDNEESIEFEKRRLESLGYEGDVLLKMYKSARYYFRTKETSTDPKRRRGYVSVDKEMLDAIDAFLEQDMKDPEFTPKKSYEKFSLEHTVPKKTFKNRYYLARNPIKNKMFL
jgi:hypothetical protein